MEESRSKNLAVSVGDLYAGRLPDGRYGAIHVVKVMEDCDRPGHDTALVAVMAYIDESPPKIDDPRVRMPLRQNRFFFNDEASVTWVTEPPPANYVCVGSFPVTKKEIKLERRARHGSEWSLIDVSDEWPWENDREGLERDVESERAERDGKLTPKRRPRKRTPEARLDESSFWKLVNLIDFDVASGEQATQRLVAALSERSKADLVEFQELLAEALYALDTERFAAGAGDAGRSDDAFLYARCDVVARGETYYRRVLASDEAFPKDVDFESLLSAAAAAAMRSTGESWEHVTHLCYETGSNAEGWPESS